MARLLPPPTASEAAFERLLMHFDDPTGAEPTLDLLGSTVQNVPRPRDPQIEAIADPAADANIAFLDALFAKKDTYLEGDRFSSIGDADEKP